jgi:hypothetical protein
VSCILCGGADDSMCFASSVAVVTGFIGHDPEGRITTLGRGGSDLTASTLGAATDVDEIQVWKDVNGESRMVILIRMIRMMMIIITVVSMIFGPDGLDARCRHRRGRDRGLEGHER